MKNIFKLKLIVAIGIVLAATFSTSADTYTEADAAKRTYLVPSDGELMARSCSNYPPLTYKAHTEYSALPTPPID